MTSIIISIITFKRPQLLIQTLQSLQAITIPPHTDVSLVVIDNDIQKSALPAVDAIKDIMPFPVSYQVEEQRGIPHARNAALRASQNADYLAFIDDDDTADKEWLASLYEAVVRFNCDVVMGRIHYIFESQKNYLRTIDTFSVPASPTGTLLDSAWTGNVLFSTRLYKDMGLRFDPDFLSTGGSDHHFFHAAKHKGAKIILCQEAVINIRVPPERTKWRWLARRNMRVGKTLTVSDIKENGFRRSFGNAMHSAWDSLKYFFRLMRGVFAGTTHIIHPAMVLCFIIGRILGIMPVLPRESR